jgi:hypothetical protein
VVVFQGSAWWLCKIFVQRQTGSYYGHMVDFAKISIVWAILVLIHAILGYGASLSALMRDSEPGKVVSTSLLLFAIIVLYLASLSYSVRGKGFLAVLRKTMSKAVEMRIIGGFAVIAAGFALLGLLLAQAEGSQFLSAILQLLVVLPALSVSRILLITASRD